MARRDDKSKSLYQPQSLYQTKSLYQPGSLYKPQSLGQPSGTSAKTAPTTYSYETIKRGADGKLWATQPTADDYAAHYADGTGETVYRYGSDVNLSEYPAGQFNVTPGTLVNIAPSSIALAAALLHWEAGTLRPGALTDSFLYGSLGGVTVLDGGYVQLGYDIFNFNMEPNRAFRNWMTQVQHDTLGRGKAGKDFQTIFVGPTKAP